MNNPQNTAELLFHLLALLTQRLSDVAEILKKRKEVNPKSINPWTGISRHIGEDIFNKPVDQTDFDGEVSLDTVDGIPFSFSIRLRYKNQTWTIEAEVSEIEEFGATDRCRFAKVSSPDLKEIVSAAIVACDWLIARATDFDYKPASSKD